nr:MAG TPA: hypothetical protein [Caudoviricetes sp.]
MQCRGKQYVLGKKEVDDGAIRCGNKGYHSCEAPFDVLRHYPNINGNRFFEAEAGGTIDKAENDDTKLASSELTLKSEINFAGLVKAQIEYTRKKAKEGTACGGRSNLIGGYRSNLVGGEWSNLSGGEWSNLIGGGRSNLVGGGRSNLIGGGRSNLVGGYRSNLVGGEWSNLSGGDESNLIGGGRSNLVGGDESNLIGGDESNLVGGDSSLIIGRNECSAKGGIHSVIVLTEWKYDDNGNYVPIDVKAEIVDGVRIKADTWYKLENGEFVEVDV